MQKQYDQFHFQLRLHTPTHIFQSQHPKDPRQKLDDKRTTRALLSPFNNISPKLTNARADSEGYRAFGFRGRYPDYLHGEFQLKPFPLIRLQTKGY